MEILYVCHRLPFPPKRGGKIRPFNMIRHLSRTHRVTVASLARSEEEAAEGKGLEEYADVLVGHVSEPWQTFRMFGRLPSRTPSSMGYFYSGELASKIEKAIGERSFDFVFVHCSSVAQYVAHLKGVPKILDFGDMDSQKWLVYSQVKKWPLSLGYLVEGRKLEQEERRLARQFDLCTCTTKKELETLNDYRTGVDTDWFPNGVDSEFFAPDGESYDEDLISFVGRMDYYPNQKCMIDFCKDVFPAIVERRPQTKLVIVGANPAPEIRELSRIPSVTVTGSVPDVRPYVRKSAVMVAPLTIARGTQNKILESMAMGVPTVTSTVAAGGVDAVPGEHLLTGTSTDDYVQAISRLLDNPEQRAQFAERGRARVLSHHDWSASMNRMDKIIDRVLEGFHTTTNSSQRAG